MGLEMGCLFESLGVGISTFSFVTGFWLHITDFAFGVSLPNASVRWRGSAWLEKGLTGV